MHTIINILEHLHVDVSFGGGGKSIDLINTPQRPNGGITPNRRKVFKRYNYRFKQD